jgi:hypothetical protein
VGRDLLLQGRPASDRAKTIQVAGMDSKFRTPERDPDRVAVGRDCGCPGVPRENIGSRDWHRDDYWSRSHHCLVPRVRLFVFANEMRALPNNQMHRTAIPGRGFELSGSFERWIRSQGPMPVAVGDLGR